MSPIISVVAVLFFIFSASIAVERWLGRSRKEFRKPGWFMVFYGLFIPGVAVVYYFVASVSQFIYAAYGLAGGVAALIAQCFYGIKLPAFDEHAKR
jgi:membrane protein DedA with SNARE-associated domain